MKFDLIVLGVLALFGLLGLLSGAIRQLSQWAGLAAAYMGAGPAAIALAPWAAKRINWPPILVNLMLSGVFFLLFLAIVSAVARRLIVKALPKRGFSGADKALGFALGAANAGAIIFTALSFALYVENPRSQPAGKIAAATQGSRTVAFVREHNLFTKLHVAAIDSTRKLLASDSPSKSEVMAGNPELKALMDDPRIKEILNDPNFAARLRRLQENSSSRDGSN